VPKPVPHKVIVVESVPTCNFCEQPGPYDFPTRMGPWANACQKHWEAYRIHADLGTGKGQMWITEDQVTDA
jgi:hypothetical protein